MVAAGEPGGAVGCFSGALAAAAAAVALRFQRRLPDATRYPSNAPTARAARETILERFNMDSLLNNGRPRASHWRCSAAAGCHNPHCWKSRNSRERKPLERQRYMQ